MHRGISRPNQGWGTGCWSDPGTGRGPSDADGIVAGIRAIRPDGRNIKKTLRLSAG
jgi:hypothetical protein